MENDCTKPGFTLLRLRGETRNLDGTLPSENFLNGKHLTSKEWKEGLVTYSSEYSLNGYYLTSEKWRDFLSSASLNQETEFETWAMCKWQAYPRYGI